MDFGAISLDTVTAGALVLGGLLLLSLITLFQFFLGGSDPLMSNARARVEAARSPTEVADQGQAWRDQRKRGGLIGAFLAVLLLVIFAPEAANQLATALWSVLVQVWNALLRSAEMIVNR